MSFVFPLVYPILDSSFLPAENAAGYLDRLGRSLADAGVTLLEFRHKHGTDAEVLALASVLRAAMPGTKLILDDRVDVALAAGFDGVHVDAGDLPAAVARKLLGPGKIVGTFGGSESFEPGVLEAPADYLAVGPVYATTTKETSRPPIGAEGVKRLRAIAGPGVTLTAAAGITLETAPAILAAGANTVAVAAGIFHAADPAAEFRRWMKRLGS